MEFINAILKEKIYAANYYLDILTRTILCLIIIPLSYVIPKEENSYLMGSGKGLLFKGNAKYLYLYILRNNIQYKVSWITSSESVYNELKKRNYPVVKHFSLKGFWKILRSRYLITEMTSRDIYYLNRFWGSFNLIQTWHGTPLKKIWYHMKRDKKGIMKNNIFLKLVPFKIAEKYKLFSPCRYKLIISSSDEVSKILYSASLNKRIEVTGYPRNDVFFNKGLIFENYKEVFKFDQYKKIILYCPTFRDTYKSVRPFSRKFMNKLNLFLRENNYLFIIKKHPYERSIEIPNDLSNIIDISDKAEEVQEILIYTDILITDYSSVFFDFMLLNRPIIYYSYDYDEYIENCRGMYYNYYTEIIGPFAKNEEELMELIEKTEEWFCSEEYKVKYDQFKNRFNYYQDGRSCERLLEKINKK